MSMPAPLIETNRKVLLFVAGNESNSITALTNLNRLRESLPGGCVIDLEVVDVLVQHPVALERRILVTPCLVLVHPLPEVMIVGSLTDLDKVRVALRLPADARRHG